MDTNIDIKAFRKIRRWSQERLASELGVNQSTVARWEAAKSVPVIVAKALSVIANEHPEPAE